MNEIIKTMGGTLEFSPGTHRYIWDGEKVDLSVSAVAAQFAVPFGVASRWAARIVKNELNKVLSDGTNELFDVAEWSKTICAEPDRQARRAAEVGSVVHRWVEDWAHSLSPEWSDEPEIAQCQRGVAEWCKEHLDRVIHIEHRLYSRKWRIAGTCDMVARMRDGKTYVLDWKGVTDLDASLKFRPGHVAQLTAYRSMLEEAGEKIDGCILVRFSRATGQVEATSFSNYEADLAAFEAALHLARYKVHGDVEK